jgi:hypothetical protein
VFLHPLGLLALLGVPIVVGLHLFRRRFRPQFVSAVFLWDPQDRTATAGRKREPLRTSVSFWCEILCALLLALVFAGPRACGAGEAEHLVVVLDASASMGANPSDAGTVAEDARTLLRERIAELPRGSRVTLIASGPRPTVLAGPAAFTAEAKSVLDTFEPRLSRHDLAPSVALGLQLAGEGSVLLVTDHFNPDSWPAEVELISVGAPAENLAITNATRRRVRDEATGEALERIHLTVASFASIVRRTRVTLLTGGEPLEERDIELMPGERKHFAFTLPAGSPVIEARLPADALEVDNAAWLAPVPPRTLALTSTLAPDLSRHLGLMSPGQAASNIDRWMELVPDCVDAQNSGAAHVVLTEGAAPQNTWGLVLVPPTGERKHLVGPFLADKRHPLLDGLTFEGIVWSVDEGLALPGAPIVSAGNLPLITEERVGERLVFHVNIDPAKSSLHRSPDWPILLTNLAEMRRANLPGPARTSLAIGETFLYHGSKEAEYTFTGPQGTADTRTVRARDTLAIDDVARAGVYALARGETWLCDVAYSFSDAAESDLRGLQPGTREGEITAARVLAGFTWIEIVLLVLVLSLVALDWQVLSKGTRRSLEPTAEVS